MALGNCPSPAGSESAHVSLETECGLPHHEMAAALTRRKRITIRIEYLMFSYRRLKIIITHQSTQPSTYLTHNNHTYL